MLTNKNNKDVLNYRGVEYTYSEWTTYNGKPASGYTCEDKKLLEGVNLASFSTTTKKDMLERIDDRIDNKDFYLEMQKISDAACAEFYDKPASTPPYNWKGD
jgi:hypothetical protein